MTLFQKLVHAACIAPLGLVAWEYATDVNPIQAATLRTGKIALIILGCSLACTPANTVFGFREALRVRRAVGLYAFFYAALHFSIFLLDYGFDPALLYEAIFEKLYALVGFTALVILLLLALTSTRGWMKRLGQWWKKLHQWVYVAAVLVIVHYVWAVKADIRTPLIYGGILVLLLLARVPAIRRRVAIGHLFRGEGKSR